MPEELSISKIKIGDDEYEIKDTWARENGGGYSPEVKEANEELHFAAGGATPSGGGSDTYEQELPDGGTTGQVLAKASDDDGDVEWADLPEYEEYDDTALAGRVSANETAIATLNGSGAGSVTKTVTDEIAKVVAGAPADFDTLKEISDWIAQHPEDTAAMNSQIQANKTAIEGLADVASSGSYTDLSNTPTIPDISGKQDKTLATALTIGGASRTTVEAALGGLNGVIPSTASASNQLVTAKQNCAITNIATLDANACIPTTGHYGVWYTANDNSDSNMPDTPQPVNKVIIAYRNDTVLTQLFMGENISGYKYMYYRTAHFVNNSEWRFFNWQQVILDSDLTSTVTSGSTAPVTSGGVYSHITSLSTSTPSESNKLATESDLLTEDITSSCHLADGVTGLVLRNGKIISVFLSYSGTMPATLTWAILPSPKVQINVSVNGWNDSASEVYNKSGIAGVMAFQTNGSLANGYIANRSYTHYFIQFTYIVE